MWVTVYSRSNYPSPCNLDQSQNHLSSCPLFFVCLCISFAKHQLINYPNHVSIATIYAHYILTATFLSRPAILVQVKCSTNQSPTTYSAYHHHSPVE